MSGNLPSDQDEPGRPRDLLPRRCEGSEYQAFTSSIRPSGHVQKAMALSDDDKKKETLETNYYPASDRRRLVVVHCRKAGPDRCEQGPPAGATRPRATLLPMAYQHAVPPATPHGLWRDTRQWFSGPTDVAKSSRTAWPPSSARRASPSLILVGFRVRHLDGRGGQEPEEAHSLRHPPLSLAIQGGVCYLVEYFAANFFLEPGATR